MSRFPAPFRRPTRSAAALRHLTIAAMVTVSITACGPANDDSTAVSNGDTAAATDASVVPPATPGANGSESIVAEGPGTGLVVFAGAEDIEARVSMPPGWSVWFGVFVLKPGVEPEIGLAFYDVSNIYSDPCRWVLLDPPVGPTVDDLVAAFQESPVFQAMPATDVTVDGFSGKYIEVTVPAYDEAECVKFGLYKEDGDTDADPNFWAQAPGENLAMWVLDVDGNRLVVGAGHYPDTPVEDLEDIAEMVATLDIR